MLWNTQVFCPVLTMFLYSFSIQVEIFEFVKILDPTKRRIWKPDTCNLLRDEAEILMAYVTILLYLVPQILKLGIFLHYLNGNMDNTCLGVMGTTFKHVLNKTAKSCNRNRIRDLCVNHRPNSTVSETWRVFLLLCNPDPESVFWSFVSFLSKPLCS